MTSQMPIKYREKVALREQMEWAMATVMAKERKAQNDATEVNRLKEAFKTLWRERAVLINTPMNQLDVHAIRDAVGDSLYETLEQN